MKGGSGWTPLWLCGLPSGWKNLLSPETVPAWSSEQGGDHLAVQGGMGSRRCQVWGAESEGGGPGGGSLWALGWSPGRPWAHLLRG